MQLRLGCTTKNMKFENDDQEVMISQIKFSRDNKLADIFLTEKFVKYFGKQTADSYKKNPFFFYSTDYPTIKENEISEAEMKIFSDNGQVYLKMFEDIITSLWFAKDNCCSIDLFHLYFPDAKQAILKNESLNYTNSRGDINQLTTFNLKEIQDGLDIYLSCTELFYHNNVRKVEADEELPDIIRPREMNRYEYKNISRLERAFNFLKFARNNKDLSLKISFYICIYESLFSGNGQTEISHQIAERVALYYSTHRPGRSNIYKFIKGCYAIRSRYFHGDVIKATHESLSEKSFYLDNITREIFRRIIKEDSEIFKQSDENLEKSFMDLIFEDDRIPSGQTFESGLTHLRFNDKIRKRRF